MVGDQLGIGYDPGQHAAYVRSWIKVLREDPKEILRASRDADKIFSHVLELEKERIPTGKEAQVIEAKRPEAPKAREVHSPVQKLERLRAVGGRER